MQDRLIKILLIINFFLISISTLILGITKSDGYEISIYAAVPSYVWYFLVFSIISSICITIYQANVDCTKPWWIVGITTIMLNNLIILLLPVFRGYEVYGRWDILTHVGYVKDIIQFNEVPKDIIYPAIHILIAFISMVSNLNEVSIINYIIPHFLELYILFMYCLANTIFANKRERIIAMVAGSVLFFSYTNYQVMPFTLSVLLLPIVLYTYLKMFENKDIQFKVILIIFIVFFPFFHPLTMLILVVTFLGTYLLMVLYNKIYNKKNNIRNAMIPVLIGTIVFILWISNNYRFWNNNMYRVVKWFSGEATAHVALQVATTFEKLNMNALDIFELFIKMYGHSFIYLIISFMAGIIIIIRMWNKNNILPHLCLLLGWFSIYNLFLIMHIFFTVLKFGFWRVIAIAVVSTPIFVGYVSGYKVIDINQRLIIYTLIIISSIIGIFNIFPSPYTLQTNQQVTNSEIIGMGWYYTYKNISTNDLNIKSCFRFADFILGNKIKKERSDILNCEREDTVKSSLKLGLVPKHFAYTNFSIFSDFIKSEKRFENFSYMPIFKYERIYYADIYPQLDEFNKNDFEKLDYDISLEKIYDNNNVEIWKLKF